MSRHRFAALACASAVIAGCGGDGESGDKLSKAEFVAQADKICRTTNSRANDVEEPSGFADLDRYVDEATPIVEEQRDKLRDLEDRAPDDVSADFSKMVDIVDQQIDTFGEFKAAGTDRARLAETGVELDRLGGRFETLARRIGLDECEG